MSNRSRRPWSSRWLLPVLLAIAVAGYALFAVVRSGDETPEPIAVEAAGPTFDSVAALCEASDLVVEATATTRRDGRLISDPARPNVGIATALFDLTVEERYRGEVGDALVIEQEATLLDGTPIIVNGLGPHPLDEPAIWFVVRSPDESLPYVAVVNEQGRIDLGDDPVIVVGRTFTVADLRDELSRSCSP